MAAAVAVYRFVTWASNVKDVVVDRTCSVCKAVCCCKCCSGDDDSTNGDWLYREPTGIQMVPPYIDLTDSALTFEEIEEREPGSEKEKTSFCFCGEEAQTKEPAVVTLSSVEVVITDQPRASNGDFAQDKSAAADDKVPPVLANVFSANNESANASPPNAVPSNGSGPSRALDQEVATSFASHDGTSVTINNKKKPRPLSPGQSAGPSLSAPALQRAFGMKSSGAGPPERRGRKTGSPRGGTGINLLKTASLNSFLSSVRASNTSLHAAMLDAADFGLQQFLPVYRPAVPRQGRNPSGLSRYQVLVGKTWLSKLTATGRKRHLGAKRRSAKMKDRERLVTQTTDGIRVVIEFGESTTL
ncbi:hypothetical protein Bbelb_129230 [Branchiostoma belcheri]|nr:hypothetical protein Bbelb_129230 [Branchiostoma belcheri]